VTISLGRTINIGNFESFRADVSLSMDAEPNQTGKAFNQCQKMVEERLEHICKPIEDALNDKKR